MKKALLFLLCIVSLSFSAPVPGANMSSEVGPTDSLDTYSTHWSGWGRGATRSCPDTIGSHWSRDSISALRREIGMTVFDTTSHKTFRLQGGITNAHWVLHDVNMSKVDWDSISFRAAHGKKINLLGQNKVTALTINEIPDTLQKGLNTGNSETLDSAYEAFRFVPDSNMTLWTVGIQMKRTGTITSNLGQVILYIRNESSGYPGTLLNNAYSTQMFSTFTTSNVEKLFTVTTSGISLMAGTGYWAVLSIIAPSGGTVQINSAAAGTGQYAESNNGATWTLKNGVTGWYKLYGNMQPLISGTGNVIATVTNNSPGISSINMGGNNVAAIGAVHLGGGNAFAGTSAHGVAFYGTSTDGYGVRGIANSAGGVGGSFTGGKNSVESEVILPGGKGFYVYDNPSVTPRWDYRGDGANAYNYFQGHTGIGVGDSTPAKLLHVSGGALIDSLFGHLYGKADTAGIADSTLLTATQIGYGGANNKMVGDSEWTIKNGRVDLERVYTTTGIDSPVVIIGHKNGSTWGKQGIYITGEGTINSGLDYNVDGYELALNYTGYNNGFTRYRNLGFDDGKGNYIQHLNGSTKKATFYGAVEGTTLKTNLSKLYWGADSFTVIAGLPCWNTVPFGLQTGSAITGSGTVNYLTMWGGATSIGNCPILSINGTTLRDSGDLWVRDGIYGHLYGRSDTATLSDSTTGGAKRAWDLYGSMLGYTFPSLSKGALHWISGTGWTFVDSLGKAGSASAADSTKKADSARVAHVSDSARVAHVSDSTLGGAKRAWDLYGSMLGYTFPSLSKGALHWISGTGWTFVDSLGKAGSASASDVYSWAKSSTKPTYTYSEVGADASGAASSAVNAAINGTTGYLLRHTGAHTTGNSQIRDDLNGIGIGAASRGTWKLNVVSDSNGIRGESGGAGYSGVEGHGSPGVAGVSSVVGGIGVYGSADVTGWSGYFSNNVYIGGYLKCDGDDTVNGNINMGKSVHVQDTVFTRFINCQYIINSLRSRPDYLEATYAIQNGGQYSDAIAHYGSVDTIDLQTYACFTVNSSVYKDIYFKNVPSSSDYSFRFSVINIGTASITLWGMAGGTSVGQGMTAGGRTYNGHVYIGN